MSLKWQEIKTHKLTLLGAPILCAVALLFLALLLWLESLSRGTLEGGTVIIIEAGQETSDDNALDSNVFLLSDEDAQNSVLADVLSRRYAEISSGKNNTFKNPSGYLKGIPESDFSQNDRQLFYERLGIFYVGQKKYETAVSIFSYIAADTFLQKRTGFYSALAYSKTGQIEKAIELYKRHLKNDPNHQASALNYGLLLIKTEQYEKSIPTLEHAVEITSGTRKAKALRLLGGAYERLGQIEASIEAYRQSIIFEPGNSKVWLQLGNALSSDKENVDALIVDTLQKAISLSPDNHKARLSLAEFYFSRLDFEKARFEFSEAAKRASRSPELRLMQALNLFSSGRPYSANKVLKKIRDASADDEQAAQFITYMLANDYSGAKRILDSLNMNSGFDENFRVYLQLMYFVENAADEPLAKGRVETDLDSFFYWPAKLLLARYLNKRKRYSDAIDLAKDILENIPRSAEARLVYGRSLSKSGQHALALETLAEAYKLQKTSRRISVEYIKELKKTKDYEAALGIVNDVLEQHPNYRHVLGLKVELLRKTGQVNAAIKLLTQVFNADGENFAEGYLLSELLYAEGDIELSLQTLTELLDFDSANVKARLLRVNILYAESRFAEAELEVTRILRLDPENNKALDLKDSITRMIPTHTTSEENKNDKP